MNLKLYNTLTRKKDIFKPIKKSSVGIYSCGPTVYWYQHIGNLRTYIFSDVLRKILEYNGYRVNQIINVTDVGHLTSDADTGEDKMEITVKKERKSPEEIANYYLKIFKKDLKKLNIPPPNKWTKATEHVKEQIDLIKVLEKKGFTYKTPDGIYFDTSKIKNYGKLAKLDVKGLQAGKRTSMREKKHKTDFALWFFTVGHFKNHILKWKSPWGVGFPGWHIECSAMSMKYLGKHFDIHTGGIDHIPIHHTNEIAQSEAATGKKFVNYWLHGNFLTFKGEKISKSKGGLYTISELEKENFLPLEFRYLTLTTHYRKPLNFSIRILQSSKNSYKRLKNIIHEIKDDSGLNKEYLREFEEAINDDANMPKAIQVLWNLVRDEKAKGKIKTIKEMDKVLSLDLLKEEKSSIPKEIKKLSEERDRARKDNDWTKADELRNKINKLGYSIDDTKSGSLIKRL